MEVEANAVVAALREMLANSQWELALAVGRGNGLLKENEALKAKVAELEKGDAD